MLAEASGTRLLTRRRFGAWSLLMADILLVAILLVVSRRNGSLSEFGTNLGTSLLLLAFAAAGVLMATVRPRNVLGWLFLVCTLLILLAEAAGEWATYALAVHPGTPLGEVALWLNVWLWVPALGLVFMVLPVLLPSGTVPSAAWRRYLQFAVLMCGLYTIINMVAPITADNFGLPSVTNPYGITALQPLLDPLLGIGDFLSFTFTLISLSSLVLRYRRADQVERRRVAWLAAGLLPLVAYAGVAVAAARVPALARAETVVFAFAAGAFPAAATIALLRPQLFDMDLVLRRAAVAGALAAALAGVYGAVAVALRTVLPHDPAPLAVVLPTVAMAAATRPLARRARRVLPVAWPKLHREGPRLDTLPADAACSPETGSEAVSAEKERP